MMKGGTYVKPQVEAPTAAGKASSGRGPHLVLEALGPPQDAALLPRHERDPQPAVGAQQEDRTTRDLEGVGDYSHQRWGYFRIGHGRERTLLTCGEGCALSLLVIMQELH
jgi:hypothetical protein